jgi:hypothetical protein
VSDPRIPRIQEHLYNGLALMDLVGHIDELHTLWRRDSVAYAMRLACREWQAADALLSDLAEDLHGACGGGRRIPCPTPPEQEGAGTPPPVAESVAGHPS